MFIKYPCLILKAVIFDLGNVVKETASVHAAVWKKMFDDFLAQHATGKGLFIFLSKIKDYHLKVMANIIYQVVGQPL